MRVTISAYAGGTRGGSTFTIEIKPDDRELSLGTFDLPPSMNAEQGRFSPHRRHTSRPSQAANAMSSSGVSVNCPSAAWRGTRST